MPMIEILFPRPATRRTANTFKRELFFHAEEFYDISIQNETISVSDDTTLLGFEISDFKFGEKFIRALECAYGNITAKHQKNIVTKVFHDQVGETEIYAYPARNLLRFDSLEALEVYKNSKNSIRKTAVANYIESNGVDKYAIIRVRIERKKHETQIRKAFESILESNIAGEKDALFTAALDKIIDSGEAYEDWLFKEQGKSWREDMKYQQGKIGDIPFLEALAAFHVEKKYLTLLLLNTPYEREPYIPFIWGFWGILGNKTEMKLWSKKPGQTRILWHYEDNVMGPTKYQIFDVDDWSYDNHPSLDCEYYN